MAGWSGTDELNRPASAPRTSERTPDWTVGGIPADCGVYFESAIMTESEHSCGEIDEQQFSRRTASAESDPDTGDSRGPANATNEHSYMFQRAASTSTGRGSPVFRRSKQHARTQVGKTLMSRNCRLAPRPSYGANQRSCCSGASEPLRASGICPLLAPLLPLLPLPPGAALALLIAN